MTTAAIQLSPDQKKAHDAVVDWSRGAHTNLLTLGGYAGTGKTSTIGAIAGTLRPCRIAFLCFTGKASLVLRTKLSRALRDRDYCGTVHSLIYECERKNGVRTWHLVDSLDYDLIVIDEASMIDEELFSDLSSFGIPILAVGDHGQLPPVSGTLNLMSDPQVRLDRIHRQAEGSPIIRISMLARETGSVPFGNYGPGVMKTRDRTILDRIRDPKNGVVLCGTNATRTALNAKLRGRTGIPVAGERVVCLRNDRELGIYNGSLGEVVEMLDYCPNAGKMDFYGERLLCKKNCQQHYAGKINFGDVTYEGPVTKEQFGAPKTIDEYKPGRTPGGQFDFASALTVHKSQGSEFENVIVVEECGWMPEELRRRWLYTATTRARTRLVIIGGL